MGGRISWQTFSVLLLSSDEVWSRWTTGDVKVVSWFVTKRRPVVGICIGPLTVHRRKRIRSEGWPNQLPSPDYNNSQHNVTSIPVCDSDAWTGKIFNLVSKHTGLACEQYPIRKSGSTPRVVTPIDATIYISILSAKHASPHLPLTSPPCSLPMAITLLSFPEEVLERILALCVDAQTDAFANPSWHTRQVSRRASSVLLVNKTFLRIATPLLYNTVVIRSSHQLTTILDNVFRPSPQLATFVKTVEISGGSYDGLDDFVRLCVNLEEFDMSLDNTPWEEDVREKFAESLKGMRKIKSLIVRKDAYLTQEKPKHLMNQLSDAIVAWTSLVSFLLSVNIRPVELTPYNIRSA